jgi:hypothetical protein
MVDSQFASPAEIMRTATFVGSAKTADGTNGFGVGVFTAGHDAQFKNSKAKLIPITALS